MKMTLDSATVCIIGLGYVGLPLAEAFSQSLKVVGFDIDSDKISKLQPGNRNSNLVFTDNPKEISGADFL